jgi:hypothetical protein
MAPIARAPTPMSSKTNHVPAVIPAALMIKAKSLPNLL